MKCLLFILPAIVFSIGFKAQTLSIEQVIAFSTSSTDFIESELLKEKWSRRSLQIVPDSNLIKRVWEVTMKDDGIKSYVLHFEFNKDTNENYVVYQFSDREQYKESKKKIKSLGFDHLNKGKHKTKKKTKDEHIHLEKEDYYFNKNTRSIIIVKEVFFYGLFSFMVYVYRPDSHFADHDIRPLKK